MVDLKSNIPERHGLAVDDDRGRKFTLNIVESACGAHLGAGHKTERKFPYSHSSERYARYMGAHLPSTILLCGSLFGTPGCTAGGSADAEAQGSSADVSTSASSESGSTGESDASGEPSESGETGLDPSACENPTAIMQLNTDTPSGFVRCDDGFVHREEVVACVTAPPVGNCPAGGSDTGDECSTGDDCLEGLNPVCSLDLGSGTLGAACVCKYGCDSDADCLSGGVCACAGVVSDRGQCVPTECTQDADCGDALCGIESWESCLNSKGQTACTTPDSNCRVDEDCPSLCDGQIEGRCNARLGWKCQTEVDVECGTWCGE